MAALETCPAIYLSSDPGTSFGKSSSGLNEGTTSVRLDVYVSMVKSTIAYTDQLQQAIRYLLIHDRELNQSVSSVECVRIGAVSFPGKNKLRALTHDFVIKWTEAPPDPTQEVVVPQQLFVNGEPVGK